MPPPIVLFSEDEQLARSLAGALARLCGPGWEIDFIPAGEGSSTALSLPEGVARADGADAVGRCYVLRAAPARSRGAQPAKRAELAIAAGASSGAGVLSYSGTTNDKSKAAPLPTAHHGSAARYWDSRVTNFLARAIHDLQGPLTAIRGYCGLLLDGEAGPLNSEHREILERLQMNTRRLTRAAERMTLLGAAPPSDAEPATGTSDVRSWVERALGELNSQIERKRLLVTVDMEAPAEKLLVVGRQMEDMITELLDHACRFAPRGGSVDIRGYSCCVQSHSEAVPDSYRIDFRDSGPPIAGGELELIFDRSAPCGGPQDRSGAGLALAFCRMAAIRHHGDLRAEHCQAGGVISLALPFWRPDRATGPTDAAGRTPVGRNDESPSDL